MSATGYTVNASRLTGILASLEARRNNAVDPSRVRAIVDLMERASGGMQPQLARPSLSATMEQSAMDIIEQRPRR